MPKDISVKLAIKNQKVAEELKRVIASVDGFHLLDPNDMGACDLLILDLGKDLQKELQLLRSIKASGSTGEIFLTLSSADPQVILECKRAGVGQFLFQPIKKEEVRKALLKLREGTRESLGNEWNSQRGKIIYLLGGKGGVGTTTVAVNLASNLAQSDRSRSVVVTDLTIPFGDLPAFLNLKSAPNWDDLAKNIARIRPLHLPRFLFQHPSGVFVLPSPSGPNIARDPRITGKVLSALRESHDFIVVDGGKISGHILLEILSLSDTILLIITLNSLCIANVRTFSSILFILFGLGPFQDRRLKIIINRHQKNDPIALKEAEQQMNKRAFFMIPNDFGTIMEAITQGKLISEVGKGKEICSSFERLAFLLSKDAQLKVARNGFSENIHQGFRDKNNLPALGLNSAYKHMGRTA
jgi:pilus assembly protein CpaE